MILFHNLDFFDKDGNNLNLEKIYKINVDVIDSDGSGADIKVTTNPNGQLEKFIINSGGENYSSNTKIIVKDTDTKEKYEINGEEFIKTNSSGTITDIIIPIKKSGFSFPYVIYKGNLFFNHISVGLVESEHIYITEYAKDFNKKDIYIQPRNYKLLDNSYSEFLYIDVYGDDEEIFLYEIEDKTAEFPTIIKSDNKKLKLKNGLDDKLDKSLSRNLSNKLNSVSQLNLGVKSKEEGIFERKLRIGIEYNDKIFIFAEIKLRAEITGEDERLKNMLDNFGFSISHEEVKIFRDSDVNETLPDYNLLNEKRKEMLLEYHNIFPYIGSYKGLVNILKYFDYGDLRLKEYWLNTELANREEHIKKTKIDQKAVSRISEISKTKRPVSDEQILKNLVNDEDEVKRMKLEKPTDIIDLIKFLSKYRYLPTQKENKRKLDFEQKKYKQVKIPLDLKGKGRNWEDEDFLPTGNWKKTPFLSLHYDINRESGDVDKYGIPIVEDVFMFTPEEALIKLFSLKEYLKEKFLPLNAKIIDIVGEGVYFERYTTRIWEDTVQTTYINKEYIPDFDIDSSFMIEDLYNYRDQIKDINKKVPIRKYYGYNVFNFMETDNIAQNQRGPIGSLVNLNADKFDITWDEIEITWDELLPDRETETEIFELEYDTSINTNAEEEKKIILPLYGYVNVTINWGDGNIEHFTKEGDIEHIYKYHNKYNIKIYGTLDQFGNEDISYESNKKLLKVHSFGKLNLKSLSGAFHNAINLTEVPINLPDTVIDTSYMFKKTVKFNDNKIIYWNTSNIQIFKGMFEKALKFNRKIGNWITSNAIDMSFMFKDSIFNQDISAWDVRNVIYMIGMFENSLFNRDISNWNIKSLKFMDNIFTNTTLSIGIYNNILVKWSKINLKKDVIFDVDNSNYSLYLPKESREKIITKYNWTINDGGSSTFPSVLTNNITYETILEDEVKITMYGETTFDSGIDIIEKGFYVHSTLPLNKNNYSVKHQSDNICIGKYELSGNYSSNKDWYIRAYAINSNNEISYGEILKFDKLNNNNNDDKEHEINSWDTVEFAEFHEIEWRFTHEKPQKYSTSIRKKLIDGLNITARLPYTGKYNIEMLLFDMTNNCIKINKNIDIKMPEVDFIMLSRFLYHKETWDDLEKNNINWNNIGGEWRNCGIQNDVTWDDCDVTWDDLELEKYKIEPAKKQFPRNQSAEILRISKKDRHLGKIDKINLEENSIIVWGHLKQPRLRNAINDQPQDFIYFKRDDIIHKCEVHEVEYKIEQNQETLEENKKTYLKLNTIPNDINKDWKCLREIGNTILLKDDITHDQITRKKGLKENTWIKLEKEKIDDRFKRILIKDVLKDTENNIIGIELDKNIIKKPNKYGNIYKIRKLFKNSTPNNFEIVDNNKIKLNYIPEENEIIPGFTIFNMKSLYKNKEYNQKLLVEHWDKNNNIIYTKELDGDFSLNENAEIEYIYWNFIAKLSHYFVDELEKNEVTLNFNDYQYCINFLNEDNELNGDWYFDYQDRTGFYTLLIKNIGFENNNTLITVFDNNSDLFKVNTDFKFSWSDFDEDYAENRIGINIHTWDNMFGVNWDDLYHLQWSQFEYFPASICGFEITNINSHGIIRFNEHPEFSFSNFSELTEKESWEKALYELQNTNNSGLSRFNYYLIKDEHENYKMISAIAKNKGIVNLGYIEFENGVEGIYPDSTTSHTYPMGYYNEWNEPHLYGHINKYANWKPLARTYYEFGYDSFKNKGWFPANIYIDENGKKVKTLYKPKKVYFLSPDPSDLDDPIYGIFPNLKESVDWRIGEGSSNLYDYAITSPFNWNDLFISKYSVTLNKMTTIFFITSNCKIAGQRRFEWKIFDRNSQRLLCRTTKNELIWTFTYSGVFDISLSIEDLNRNKKSITKNGLITII